MSRACAFSHFLFLVSFLPALLPAQQLDFRALSSHAAISSDSAGPAGESRSEALPSAPEPADDEERPNVPWAAKRHWQPLSRIGIGADISPLGIGIKSATILTQYFDVRLMGNFFNDNTHPFELEGFRVNADFHLASGAAALDWYPLNSVFRLSVGTLFFNDNKLAVRTTVEPGTSFSLNGQTFYPPNANLATGATPLTATGAIGVHARQPALTLSGGFGKFVPRSERHWSFPAEFGVALTGAPTLNVNPADWVCLDEAETRCSNVGNPAAPVTAQFNSALNASLAKWRRGLGEVTVYPLFSYSVVYSFDVR